MVFQRNWVFWRNCPGKSLHLLGSLWVFHIPKETPFLQHYFFYFQCISGVSGILGTLHNSFLFNSYMICIYFMLMKIKGTLLKKINVLTTLTFRNHGYPIFVGVSVLKVVAYGNTQRACWFIIYHCCRIPVVTSCARLPTTNSTKLCYTPWKL